MSWQDSNFLFFECPYCPKYFNTEEQSDSHFTRRHGGGSLGLMRELSSMKVIDSFGKGKKSNNLIKQDQNHHQNGEPPNLLARVQSYQVAIAHLSDGNRDATTRRLANISVRNKELVGGLFGPIWDQLTHLLTQFSQLSGARCQGDSSASLSRNGDYSSDCNHNHNDSKCNFDQNNNNNNNKSSGEANKSRLHDRGRDQDENENKFELDKQDVTSRWGKAMGSLSSGRIINNNKAIEMDASSLANGKPLVGKEEDNNHTTKNHEDEPKLATDDGVEESGLLPSELALRERPEPELAQAEENTAMVMTQEKLDHNQRHQEHKGDIRKRVKLLISNKTHENDERLGPALSSSSLSVAISSHESAEEAAHFQQQPGKNEDHEKESADGHQLAGNSGNSEEEGEEALTTKGNSSSAGSPFRRVTCFAPVVGQHQQLNDDAGTNSGHVPSLSTSTTTSRPLYGAAPSPLLVGSLPTSLPEPKSTINNNDDDQGPEDKLNPMMMVRALPSDRLEPNKSLSSFGTSSKEDAESDSKLLGALESGKSSSSSSHSTFSCSLGSGSASGFNSSLSGPEKSAPSGLEDPSEAKSGSGCVIKNEQERDQKQHQKAALESINESNSIGNLLFVAKGTSEDRKHGVEVLALTASTNSNSNVATIESKVNTSSCGLAESKADGRLALGATFDLDPSSSHQENDKSARLTSACRQPESYNNNNNNNNRSSEEKFGFSSEPPEKVQDVQGSTTKFEAKVDNSLASESLEPTQSNNNEMAHPGAERAEWNNTKANGLAKSSILLVNGYNNNNNSKQQGEEQEEGVGELEQAVKPMTTQGLVAYPFLETREDKDYYGSSGVSEQEKRGPRDLSPLFMDSSSDSHSIQDKPTIITTQTRSPADDSQEITSKMMMMIQEECSRSRNDDAIASSPNSQSRFVTPTKQQQHTTKIDHSSSTIDDHEGAADRIACNSMGSVDEPEHNDSARHYGQLNDRHPNKQKQHQLELETKPKG